MAEINKTNFPNYLIYDDGRVWSRTHEKFKITQLSIHGYERVSLYKNIKKQKNCFIHRLVALHYIPNPNNYPTVDHIDRNKLNNHISNLRWASRSMQNENKNAYSNTGEKYIYLKKRKGRSPYYYIEKKKCFRKTLTTSKYTLDDAINLRDSLLSI